MNINDVPNTLSTAFQRELDPFIVEFQDKLRCECKKGTPLNKAWRMTRDMLLIDYPLLRETYAAHGEEYMFPLYDQSPKAKLGRVLAGQLHTIRDKLEEELDTKNLCQSSSPGFHESTRRTQARDKKPWTKAPEIRPSNKQTVNTKYIYADEMIDKLNEVKQGQEIVFTFDSKENAIQARSFLGHNMDRTNWYKDVPAGKRPWATKLEEIPRIDPMTNNSAPYWELTVIHLEARWYKTIQKKR